MRSLQYARVHFPSELCLKNAVHQTNSITLSIFNFSSTFNFFHWHTLWKICNKVTIKYPTTT